MGKTKGSKRQKKHGGASRFPKTTVVGDSGFRGDDDFNDDIDAFHKQRDMVPLDVNAEVASDDEMDEPVFHIGGVGDESDNTDDGEMDEPVFQVGGVGDGSDNNEDDDYEEEKKTVWGKHKNMYFQGDNADFELLSSDDDEELLAEEEEVIKMQMEKAKTYTLQDYGLSEDFYEDETTNCIRHKSHISANSCVDERFDVKKLELGEDVRKVEKDFNDMTEEELMEVVHRTAPLLVGYLAEGKEVIDRLNKLLCLLSKIKEKGSGCVTEMAMKYLTNKKNLLFLYLQAIVFYLFMIIEGHSLRGHPVIPRLAELKDLFEIIKKNDKRIPIEFEQAIMADNPNRSVVKKINVLKRQPCIPDEPSTEKQEEATVQVHGKIPENIQKKPKTREEELTMKMLEVRADLEKQYKQLGYINSKGESTKKPVAVQPLRKYSLTTVADYDDVIEPLVNGQHGSSKSHTLSQLIASRIKKPMKHVSGDDDVPIRDDIGERRRKYEVRVLNATADRYTNDQNMEDQKEVETHTMDVDQEVKHEDSEGGEDEFYKQAKAEWMSRQSCKKIKELKSKNKPRGPLVVSAQETETEGERRPITREMEMNRGLTRYRKKISKTPRKKYKMKHQKAVVRRKGQVRSIRTPGGPYGGEASGINVNVSHSIRFKY